MTGGSGYGQLSGRTNSIGSIQVERIEHRRARLHYRHGGRGIACVVAGDRQRSEQVAVTVVCCTLVVASSERHLHQDATARSTVCAASLWVERDEIARGGSAGGINRGSEDGQKCLSRVVR